MRTLTRSNESFRMSRISETLPTVPRLVKIEEEKSPAPGGIRTLDLSTLPQPLPVTSQVTKKEFEIVAE